MSSRPAHSILLGVRIVMHSALKAVFFIYCACTHSACIGIAEGT